MEQAELGSACLAAPKRRFPDNERCGRESVAVLVQPVLQQIPAEEEPEIKQRKKEQEQKEAVDQDTDPNLMDFCDELLFEIFQYLDTSSVLAVMHCSPRLENLLLDHRFYHNIDLSNGPLPMGILEEILGRATEKTHTIKICGPPSSQHVAGEFRQFTQTLSSVFPRVVQLKVLELQGVSLDFEYMRDVVRNYISSQSYLEHCAVLPNLVYIDVSGTSVTLPAIGRFRISKPKCEVVANHLEEIEKLPEVEPQEEDDTVVVLLQPPPRADGDQPPKSPPPQEVVAP
ncbi:GD18053 [Drosophila simulans]|uniref:GD18053 n=1 Tax=Drosophila simulans TaxID=7240 RepID=B4QY49_DROSI|nr:GD18053 [Drosophila simulans]